MPQIRMVLIGLVILIWCIMYTTVASKNETNSTDINHNIGINHRLKNTTKKKSKSMGNKTSKTKDNVNHQQEAHRQRKIKVDAVKRTIQSSQSESCDFLINPMSVLKGDVCGSYYKILNIDRRNSFLDKNVLKKSYRRLSLAVHPDKNPSDDAETAFTLLQNAYECLSDSACQERYNQELSRAEELILHHRILLKERLYNKTATVLQVVHHYWSVTASHLVQAGSDFWELLGDWQVTLFNEQWSFGKPLVFLLLLWKARFVLQLYLLSWVTLRANSAWARGANKQSQDTID